MISQFYHSLAFPIGFTVVLLASIAGGYFFAPRLYLRRERSWRASGVETGIIGFYGLLLSFALLTIRPTYGKYLDLEKLLLP